MTTKDLRNSVEKVLGNSIRCLLPSYWWKRLFHQVADTIDTINGVEIVGSEAKLQKLDAQQGSLASVATRKEMKPSEFYVPTDEDSNLTDEEFVAKLTRLTGLEVSFPLPDITGVEAVAVLVSEDAWLGFLAISDGFCFAAFAESLTNEKTFLLTSQSSVNSLNTFLKQHKFYYVGLDFEPEDTEEYIKETTELFDRIFTIVDCNSDVYVKGLAWERLAKEGESGSASVPSYTLYYTTYKVNGVTTMADKYINLNKEEYAKIIASQKAKENYLLQVVELGTGEGSTPVDVELSWFSIADDTDGNFNVTVCSFFQWDGANQPQRRLVSFKSDGTAEYELIPTGDVKFLYYADGANSLSAKEKAHNASAILPIRNSFDSSFTPSPIIIRYKIDSTKYLSLQGILSGNDAEGDGVSLTAFVSPNVYYRFNYDLATGEPAKAEPIQIGGGEGSYDDTGIKKDIADLQAKDRQHDAKLAELSEELASNGQLIEDLQNMKIDRENDDYYPKMAVGLADNLAGVDVVDSEINLRRSGGGAITDGVARIESIKGNSVVWNQMVNGAGSLTLINSHKYMTIIGGVAEVKTSIVTLDVAEGDRVHDLTKMFGAGNEPTTIEEFYARIPMGVDLNAYNEGEVIHMHVQSIKSVGVNQWDEEWEVGEWDIANGVPVARPTIRSKNFIPIVEGERYKGVCAKGNNIGIVLFDANKNYLTGGVNALEAPSNAAYAKIFAGGSYGTTYNNDICFGISGDWTGYHAPIEASEDLSLVAKYFPEGMKSVGTAHDEIRYNKASGKREKVVRIGEVDMGGLYYERKQYGDIYAFEFLVSGYAGTSLTSVMSPMYTTKGGNASALQNMEMRGSNSPTYKACYLRNDAYATGAELKAAMAGVMLYYELAEPIVTELDEADQFKDLDYQVWNAGTEKAIAEGKSAPLAADITYGFNAIGKIKELESLVAALRAKVGI